MQYKQDGDTYIIYVEQDEEILQLINKVEQEGVDIRELINSLRKDGEDN